MTTTRRISSFCSPRNWRGLVAIVVATVYLLAGVLHGAHDIDVTSPSGGSEIASLLDSGFDGHGDHKALAGHHCHGCFSVAVVQPLQSGAATDLMAAPVQQRVPALIGIAPDTVSPPPKS
ncbi:hypothetical protein L6654_18140 [Bradyrhizobium sp. WYCCWR 13023]|uniref:DUF2946 domain-containing protein n=1 Tax=Bradyrhizobium zhengyangense TaxID=2911009 RepID=A0A9X1UAM8_9BRAD|nr:hypothetical protein [Bradyrhizobium zhengyangense]MCG2665327.1 hypothetical protein [Bradyrhizobium zhengyangense]